MRKVVEIVKKKYLIIASLLVTLTVVIGGIHIERSYAIKDRVSAIMLKDSINNESEKSSINNLIKPGLDWAAECIAKDKSVRNPMIGANDSPNKVGIPYKVFYVNVNSLRNARENFQGELSNHFWEYPVLNKNDEIITTCTMGKYNGKWEPCLINSGLSEDMIKMSSSFDGISDSLMKNDIKDPVEIKHVRFIAPFQFDAFYVNTASKQEYIIPISLRHDLMQMENLKAYAFSDVMDKLVEQLDILKYTLPVDDKGAIKPLVP